MTSILFLMMFLYVRYGHGYSKNGPPLINFEAIVPKGFAMYAYYGLPNPKAKIS